MADLGLTSGALKGILSTKEAHNFVGKPIVAQVSNVKQIDQKDEHGNLSVRYRVLLNDGVYSLHGLIPSECIPYCESNGFKKTSIINIKKYEVVTSQKHIMVIQDLEVKQSSSPKVSGNLISVDAYYEEHPDEDTLQLAKKQAASTPAPAAPAHTTDATKPSAAAHYGNTPSAAAPAPVGRHVNAIEQLSPYQNQWTIKARVLYKGDLRKWSNARGEGKLFNVNLLDESDEIRATAFNDMADKYFQELEEGKVYYVSKARIQQAKPQFSHLSHPYELSLDRDTVIEECLDVSSRDVPKVQYNFVKLDQIQNLEPNTIIDVIGVLKTVDEPFQITAKLTGKPFDRRNVTIVDDTNFAITVGLWNTTALDFSISEGSVVAFKGVKVQDFGGRSLSLLPGGSVLANPDTPELYLLKGWYDTRDKNETYQTMKLELGALKLLSADRKTILQAQEENLGLNEKPDFFNIKATISFVRTEGTFCYPSCTNEVNGSACNRKVVDNGHDGWRCERCDITFAEPEYRYILSVSVMDATGQMWMTLFDNDARKLLGKSANELRKLKEDVDMGGEGTPNEYQKTIQLVTNKEFNFRVKARQDSYNGVTRIRYQASALGDVNIEEECQMLCSELDAMLK